MWKLAQDVVAEIPFPPVVATDAVKNRFLANAFHIRHIITSKKAGNVAREAFGILREAVAAVNTQHLVSLDL